MVAAVASLASCERAARSALTAASALRARSASAPGSATACAAGSAGGRPIRTSGATTMPTPTPTPRQVSGIGLDGPDRPVVVERIVIDRVEVGGQHGGQPVDRGAARGVVAG